MTTETKELQMSGDYAVHPAAALFPMLPQDELDELAESIAQDGLLQAIVLDDKGRILDGRNRLAACKLAGVEPRFEKYEGDDPDGFALTVNIKRRHLTKGQRAMAVAMAYPEAEKGGRGKVGKLPKFIGEFSGELIRQARHVLRVTPENGGRVMAGAIALAKAYEQATWLERETSSLEARVERLRARYPELAMAVDEERLQIISAEHEADLRDKQWAEQKRVGAKGIVEFYRWAASAGSKTGPELLGNPEVIALAVEELEDLPRHVEQMKAGAKYLVALLEKLAKKEKAHVDQD